MQKPLQILQAAIGKPVAVALRSSSEVRGVLDGFDPHLNLVIKDAQELESGKEVARHPMTVVRGDSVAYISRIEADDGSR